MTGEFKHNLDARGRLFIPAKLREELGEQFYVTKGLDNCLFVYAEAAWKEIEQRISSMPLSKSRNLQRMLLANAARCELDSQGRIVLPQPLREYAALEREVAIIGIGSRAEIWEAGRWDAINGALGAESLAEAMDELGF